MAENGHLSDSFLVNTGDIRDSFTAAERVNVMTRVCLPHDHLNAMLPEASRELTPAQVQSVIDFLNDSGVAKTCADFSKVKAKSE